MHTIYRVEHKYELHPDTDHYVGPFNGGDGAYWYCQHMLSGDRPNSHPLPECDNINTFNTGNDVFGCLSLDDVLTWFPDFKGRQAMQVRDWCVRAYDINYLPRTRIGGIQVCVNKNKLRNGRVIELTDLKYINEAA